MNGSPGDDRPPQPPSTDLAARLGGALRRAAESTQRFRSAEGLLELAAVSALLGGSLLILAEFLTLFEIESRGVVVKEQAGGSHHAYAMMVLGAGAIAATFLARSTEQWLPAVGIVVLAGFALGFALIGDLPDATRTDLVRGARIAEAHPTLGFWTELVGAFVTLVSGLALARLLRSPTADR